MKSTGSEHPRNKAVRTDEFRQEGKQSKKVAAIKFVATVAIAAAADGLQVMFPLVYLPIDVVAALAFVLMWGLRWEIAVALLPELVPGVDMFPCWMALAVYFSGQSIGKKPVVPVTDAPSKPRE